MESKFDVRDVIVIDNGADSIKIGFSGEDKPRVIKFIILRYILGNYTNCDRYSRRKRRRC